MFRALGKIRVALGLGILLLMLMAALWADGAQAAWLDRSHDIFFPAQFRDRISVQYEFPTFWWNFIVVDSGAQEPDWPALHRFCGRLKERIPAELSSVECDQNLKSFQNVLKDWARDAALRKARPSDEEILKRMDSALAQASLPSGESGLLDILRRDPLGEWNELKDHAQQRMPIKLPRVNGFFYDSASHRVLIPFQARFAPKDTPVMRGLRDFAQAACIEEKACGKLAFVGSHAASLSNEEQITRDTAQVSRTGTAILLLVGIFIAVRRRWRLFLLLPIVFAAVGISIGFIVLLDGGIHGLTLSFGTAIIGLALDYGFYSALNGGSRRIWMTNLIGMLTTLSGLAVPILSSIPLMRQMMVFSSVGLISAFLLFYLFCTKWPQCFAVEPFLKPPARNRWKLGLVVMLLAGSIGGALTLRPNLDMAQFDFREESSKDITVWLFKTLQLRAPLFRVHATQEALKASHEEKAWADSNGIGTESIASYLPPPEEQQRSLRTWKQSDCSAFKGRLSAVQQKFFAPFIDSTLCGAQSSEADALWQSGSYLAHLKSGNRWLTLFFPQNDAQESKVKQRFPDATSMREVFMAFPEILKRELFWMAPLSMAIALLVLLIYYRNLALAGLAVLPFFSGMGLLTLSIWLFHDPFSFVSLMGTVMVFGFSLDYGIFATDATRDPGQSWQSQSPNVWTAVALAAISTLSGFLPLLVCKHPVLNHLGKTLFFGVVGTYLGTIWGIPGRTLLWRTRQK